MSDFGLTKFKEEMNRGGPNKEIQGSVHWTAPEILNEALEIDYMLTDVYSFGIILWELITRQQPYFGLRYFPSFENLLGIFWVNLIFSALNSCWSFLLGTSPAAVAVAVIRDRARPPLPEDEENSAPPEFIEIIAACWHQDPSVRPSFLEVMTRLSALGGDGGTSSITASSSSHGGLGPGGDRFSSWTLPTNNSNGSTGSSSSGGTTNTLHFISFSKK